ncbi:MAG: hypothetical protein ACI87W_000135 [Halieaceae bacterium]
MEPQLREGYSRRLARSSPNRRYYTLSKQQKTAPPTKADIRRELERETTQFLQLGGEVNKVPTGTSAWEPGTQPPPSRPLFVEPKSERTPVPEVVAAIEQRREAMKTHRKPVTKGRTSRRRRRLVYDDFGEPLRHIWTDE